jgi:hypothetical protein
MVSYLKTRRIKSDMAPATLAFINSQLGDDVRFFREQKITFDGIVHYTFALLNFLSDEVQRLLLIRYLDLQGHRSEVRADELVVYFDCADDEVKHPHLKRADTFARGVTKSVATKSLGSVQHARSLANELEKLSVPFLDGVQVADPEQEHI